MKDKLISYIDLLFAGAPEADDMKQEILQNTLDRYDDLLSQGKSPEAAYRLAISGIGDINEILGGTAPVQSAPVSPAAAEDDNDTGLKKAMRGLAVALYILCPVPLFLLGNEIGLCLLLILVAIATAIMCIFAKKEPNKQEVRQKKDDPRQALRKSVRAMVWAIGLAVYFILSFATNAWYITWVIFPMIAAVQGLVIACMDLKEAGNK